MATAARAAGSWPAAPAAAAVVESSSADDDGSVPRPKPAATASCAAADTPAADIAEAPAAGPVALLFVEGEALVAAFAVPALAFGVEVAASRAAVAAEPISDVRLEPFIVVPGELGAVASVAPGALIA